MLSVCLSSTLSSPCNRSALSTWSLEAPEQGRQRNRAATNLVGEGRQADRRAFLAIAFGLAVQRLVLAELLQQHHRKQAGAGPTTADHVERRQA